MAKIVKKKTGLRKFGSAVGASGVAASTQRPQYVEKTPPCIATCPNNNQIRKWLTTLAKAEPEGKSYEDAMQEAFYLVLETTPFPAVCGRVCPHPCEAECNRKEKDGAVSINQVERAIGDFGLEKKLPARKLTEEKRPEKIAVVGSGPAGLSCAYNLARRGYAVTVFEAFPKAGGMLRYGIPDYRLPPGILDAEIRRILDMGVTLQTNVAVGHDLPMEELRKDYKAIFVGLGAHRGLNLRVEGEDAPNVLTGTDYLHRVNSGERVDIGANVVVVGGGDTAIDAARVARRMGSSTTILYRRTREEMPAIDEEVVRAEEEGIKIEFLAAPLEIHAENGRATGMKCQRMQLGDPDESGRRRPVPIPGDTFDLPFTTLITAISQQPDFTGFDDLREGKDWIKVDGKKQTKLAGTYSGGDDITLGLVVDAVAHGRMAAIAICEMITGEASPAESPALKVIKPDGMDLSHYPESAKIHEHAMPVEERLGSLVAEVVSTFTKEEVLHEAARCMSCGYCFDCGKCWSFCQDSAIIKPLVKGQEYKFKLEFCTGCAKCAENCPCGYIEMM
jgi:formate dehydrogenase major subunit